MPTIIDALIVTLGIDASKFTSGQKQASVDLAKTKENANAAAKQIEASGQQAAQFFSKMRNEALKLFLVFTAGRGIKDMVRDLTAGDLALERSSAALGMSRAELNAWQKTAEKTGGSAEGITASIQRMSAAFEQNKLYGTGLEKYIPAFDRLHMDPRGKSPTQIYKELNENPIWQAMTPQDKTEFGINRLDLDQGGVNMLSLKPAAFTKMLSDSTTRGAPSDKDIAAALAFDNAIKDLRTNADNLFRTVLTDLSPAISGLMKNLDLWLNSAEGKATIKGWTDDIHDFVTYLVAIDWTSIGANLKSFLGPIDDVVQSLGGWKLMLEGLLGLYVASKFSALASGLALIAGTISNPAVLLALAAWTAYYAAHKKWAVETQADADAQWKNLPQDSPLWNNAPADIKTKYGHVDGAGTSLWERHAPSWLGGKPAMPSVPYHAGDLLSKMGVSSDQYDSFKASVAKIEGARYDQMGGSSKRFAGRYQMGASEIAETAARLGVAVPTRAQFLADPQMQERFFEAYTSGHHSYLMAHSAKYRAQSPSEQLATLGYAHNQGAGGASRWLETGQVGRDANNTAGTEYSNSIRGNLAADLHTGARAAGASRASSGSTANDNSTSVHTGAITIHTRATDAPGIAGSLQAALSRMTITSQANRGLA